MRKAAAHIGPHDSQEFLHNSSFTASRSVKRSWPSQDFFASVYVVSHGVVTAVAGGIDMDVVPGEGADVVHHAGVGMGTGMGAVLGSGAVGGMGVATDEGVAVSGMGAALGTGLGTDVAMGMGVGEAVWGMTVDVGITAGLASFSHTSSLLFASSNPHCPVAR